jgi:YrbI family 3-deoxy-D-manno-octulosonate 8-phosphate phosphatase
MSIIAVIPARGGSKGVPGKNLRRVGGVPLVVRAVQAAMDSIHVDRVIVSTDDPAIAAAARSAGAEVIDRPAVLATDEASSEAALLHVIDEQPEQPDVLVFIQATSPFLDLAALDAAIERVRDGEEDVVFSAVETYEFLWDAAGNGVNHDPSARPRRQDRDAHYRETGAFYVMDVSGFRASGHRFFGRIGLAIVDARTAIEIDTFDELELSNAVASRLDVGPLRPVLDVDAVVTDFDGVHTDDRVLIGADGSEYVTTSRSDGMGVRMLREAGIPVLILSTEQNPVVSARAAKLRVEVLQGVDDKAGALVEWAASRHIRLDRIAYLGNDVNDLGCLDAVGWPIAVPGAVPEVLAAARVVLENPGGYGAVRELAEMVLRSPGERVDEEWEEPWLYPSVAKR